MTIFLPFVQNSTQNEKNLIVRIACADLSQILLVNNFIVKTK